MSWHTVNDTVLATGHQLLIADPTRFDGVQVLGVDEDAWRHTRRKFVIISTRTPVRDGTGPSRLLGHGRRPIQTGVQDLARGPGTPAFRDGIEIEAMERLHRLQDRQAEVPDAVAVMDPFYGVALAGDVLDHAAERRKQVPARTAAGR